MKKKEKESIIKGELSQKAFDFIKQNEVYMRAILLGPPGAGKGTLAEQLVKKYPIAHVSTGDLFRYNIKNQTELGRKAKEYMDRGELVPDSLTCDMLKDKLQSLEKGQGFLLDGFPRNLFQAEVLEDILKELEVSLDLVINVKLADEIIIDRLEGRRVCTTTGTIYHIKYKKPKVEGISDETGLPLVQRPDDTKEVIEKRLKIYHEQTAPLVEYYGKKNLLFDVDNSGTAEEALQKVIDRLDGKN